MLQGQIIQIKKNVICDQDVKFNISLFIILQLYLVNWDTILIKYKINKNIIFVKCVLFCQI